MEENVFVVIINKLVVQKKYQNVMLKIVLKVKVSKCLKCLKK